MRARIGTPSSRLSTNPCLLERRNRRSGAAVLRHLFPTLDFPAVTILVPLAYSEFFGTIRNDSCLTFPSQMLGDSSCLSLESGRSSAGLRSGCFGMSAETFRMSSQVAADLGGWKCPSWLTAVRRHDEFCACIRGKCRLPGLSAESLNGFCGRVRPRAKNVSKKLTVHVSLSSLPFSSSF